MARPKGFKRHKPFVTKDGPFCDSPKRKKPGQRCKLIAGYKTDHPGQGRCYLHGGNIQKQLKHGYYSSIKHNGIREKLEQLGNIEANVLDLVPEAQMLRALTVDFIDRYEDFVDALMEWYNDKDSKSKPRRVMDIADAARLIDSIGKMVERIHKMRQEGAISLETFRRVTEQMGVIVARHVADTKCLAVIEHDWANIAIDAKQIDHHAAKENTDVVGDEDIGDEEWEDD